MITKEDAINVIIKDLDTNKISDGYHTFKELYDHRVNLFIIVCKYITLHTLIPIWRSIKHSDGSVYKDWFLLGIHKDSGKQITYHVHIDLWPKCHFSETLDKAPDYDGHSSQDVLDRLNLLLTQHHDKTL